MSTLVECVPNFSEGRDRAKVDAIIEAMKAPGVYLLDREMDSDHNRWVITLVGERESIAEAAIRGVGRAAELIDLTRIRARTRAWAPPTSFPSSPSRGVALEDCVAIARHVGRQIWKRYQIPVYLYEAAAATPERQNLENIRRGQFEGFREEIATNPARRPDFGEPRLHPTAGATVVGARKFLIAYNIYLNTAEVEIAKQIAKAVRFSNGGLRYVKAAGFPVRGLAQVSMNLTDIEQTPIARSSSIVRAGSRPLRGDAGVQRDRGADSQEGSGDGCGVVPADRKFRFFADPGEPPAGDHGRQVAVGGLAPGSSRSSSSSPRPRPRPAEAALRRRRAPWPRRWRPWSPACRAARRITCNTSAS